MPLLLVVTDQRFHGQAVRFQRNISPCPFSASSDGSVCDQQGDKTQGPVLRTTGPSLTSASLYTVGFQSAEQTDNSILT